MQFFNPFLVARQLRGRAMDEATLYCFLVMSFVFQSLEAFVGSFATRGSQQTQIESIALHAAITLVGLHFSHRANARGDNEVFIERWLCLSVPLLFWLGLVPYALDEAFYRVIYSSYGAASFSVLHRLAPLFMLWVWGRFVLRNVALICLVRYVASKSVSNGNTAPIATP